MKLRKVKPSQIKVPELRVRARFDQEVLVQFQSSIKEAGILAPVIACQVNEDLILVDGEHRLNESIKNGDLPIDVVVFEGSMVDVLTKNLFLDHMRGKTPVSDMVKVIGALYSDFNLDPDQIKEKTGLTRDYIEKLIKISKAGSEIVDALDEQWLGVGKAYELSRLPYPAQREEIMAKLPLYRIPVKEIKEFVDNTLREMQNIAEAGPPTVVTGPRPIAKYFCEGCKCEIEPRYLRAVMLCPNCFGEVWRLAKLRPAPEVEASEETDTP